MTNHFILDVVYNMIHFLRLCVVFSFSSRSESLVVDHVYWSYNVLLEGKDVWTHLFILDMTDLVLFGIVEVC